MTQVEAPERWRRARKTARPIQHFTPIRLSPEQRSYLRRRRRADVVLGGLGLAVSALPMLMISAGVLATMGRPILFTQERVTQDGRVFRLRKFRSMLAAASDGSDSDAARLVPFGRLLRATSLDELPSLWNVVCGDMSLVGPRPLPITYLGRYSADQFARHTVSAGLTGYAQVHGRNAVAWDDRLAMDQEYVRRIGLDLDLRILMDTVSAVLSRHGVTDEGGVSMAVFPGPQSTTDLEMVGPDSDGAWACRDREGRVVLEGDALLLEPGLVRLQISEGPGAAEVEGELLDEALLLLASRLRKELDAEWAFLARGTDPGPALADALARSGYVVPGSSVRFPVASPPPSVPDGGQSLIAYLGLPERRFLHPHPMAIGSTR
ncbi:sugar transferase [Brachybacterium paraconglomeratum]|uniref:sugar transferase n=1 Tax=Brachybacterium TaxID=43668 RepID=UPI0021E0F6B5|nr:MULTISPECIES: sugar transferase [Brachybacterium]WME23019.1 sugar transferase [Brachybacterium sp. GU-2]